MKRVKKSLVLALSMTVLMTCVLSGCGSKEAPTVSASASSASAETEWEKVNIVMSTIGSETNSDTVSARKLAEEVKAETGGAINIEVYATDQLSGGDMAKSVELLSANTIQIMTTSGGTLSSTVDEKMQVHCIPFSFATYEAANEAIEGGGGAFWASTLANKGITYLNYTHNGLRQITNNVRPIKTPADMAGLKIRVPGGAVYMSVFQALGADPNSMNWSEVFTALQQGTIDGQENGYMVTNSNNLFEVQRYLTEWSYMYEANLWIANSSFWEGLKPETREYLQNKIDEICVYGRGLVEDGEADIKADFVAKGMEIYVPTEDEFNQFKEAVSSVIDEYKTLYGEDACSAFGI